MAEGRDSYREVSPKGLDKLNKFYKKYDPYICFIQDALNGVEGHVASGNARSVGAEAVEKNESPFCASAFNLGDGKTVVITYPFGPGGDVKMRAKGDITEVELEQVPLTVLERFQSRIGTHGGKA